MRYPSQNAAETRKIGLNLAKKLRGAVTLSLEGPVGSGKTTFIQGVAAGLGIRQPITSPTFVLMSVYRCHRPKGIRYFCHADAYRLRSIRELDEIGLLEFINRPDAIVAIEWGHKIKTALTKVPHQVIRFQTINPHERQLTITTRRPPAS